MRRVITAETGINLLEVPEDTPIFAKKGGKLRGMMVKEGGGWIIRTGGEFSSSGWYSSRKECIKKDSGFGFEFFIED